jgi:ATP-dependent Clp protease adapter protein ClpS
VWRILKSIFWPRVTHQQVQEVVFPPETSLLLKGGFEPEDFWYGVEILNDSQTPFEFVVSKLQEHAAMKSRDARLVAVKIHMKGGVILKQGSLEDAKRLSALILQSAREANFPLMCRAISVAEQRAAGDVRNARA